MWPELFTIPGIDRPLGTFGLLVATGFLIALGVAGKLFRRYGADRVNDPQRFGDVAMWVLIGVIAGGRLAFVLVNLDDYLADPVSILYIWEGGLVMYGGFILAVTLGVWKAKRMHMPAWQSLDVGMTAGFLGQAIGRLGCLAVGDDYGAPTDVPWAITFPDPLPHGSAFAPELAGVPVHPAQLYMSAKALALFLLGLWLLKRKKFHGQVALSLMACYAVLRYIIEFFRWDSKARGGIYRDGASPADVRERMQELGIADARGVLDKDAYRQALADGVSGLNPELLLSTSQMVGIALFVCAVAGYLVLRRKPELRVPADWPGEPYVPPKGGEAGSGGGDAAARGTDSDADARG